MSSTSAQVGPRPMRFERAQLPAKAAPKTSAPMRMAALTTVSTWIQTILRSLLRLLMATGPGDGGNVPETAGSIKAYFLRLSCAFLCFLGPSWACGDMTGAEPRAQLRHAFARIVVLLVAPLAHELFE